jgi:hypothetical protein
MRREESSFLPADRLSGEAVPRPDPHGSLADHRGRTLCGVRRWSTLALSVLESHTRTPCTVRNAHSVAPHGRARSGFRNWPRSRALPMAVRGTSCAMSRMEGRRRSSDLAVSVMESQTRTSCAVRSALFIPPHGRERSCFRNPTLGRPLLIAVRITSCVVRLGRASGPRICLCPFWNCGHEPHAP